MYFYYGLFVFCLVLGLQRKKLQNNAFLLMFIVLLILGAIRSATVGADVLYYCSEFKTITYKKIFDEAHDFEPGFYLMMCVFKDYVSKDPMAFIHFVFIIYIVCNAWFINRFSRHPAFTLFLIYALTFYLFAYNGMRQSMCHALCLLCIPLLCNDKKNTWSDLICKYLIPKRFKNKASQVIFLLILYKIVITWGDSICKSPVLKRFKYKLSQAIFSLLRYKKINTHAILYCSLIIALSFAFHKSMVLLLMLLPFFRYKRWFIFKSNYLFMWLIASWFIGFTVAFFVADTLGALSVIAFSDRYETYMTNSQHIGEVSYFSNAIHTIYFLFLVYFGRKRKDSFLITSVFGRIFANILSPISWIFNRLMDNLLFFMIIPMSNIWFGKPSRERTMFRIITMTYLFFRFYGRIVREMESLYTIGQRDFIPYTTIFN